MRFARIQVLVQGLVPGGAAETSAVVNVGDEIISINNVLVRDLGLGIHARTILACDSLTFSFDVCCWQDPFMDRAHRAVKTACLLPCVCARVTRCDVRKSRGRCQDVVGSRKYDGGVEDGGRHQSAAEAGRIIQIGYLRRSVRSRSHA